MLKEHPTYKDDEEIRGKYKIIDVIVLKKPDTTVVNLF